MSYVALYRKWRPLVFSDMVEQEHVVKTLRNSVKSGRIGHAYLFSGTRGTGKTTMAKIFARAINCLQPVDGNPCNQCEICREILNETLLDVIEIDAASNNRVENVREIRDEVAYLPSKARYKVYIVDEVHMLSTGAFNALLKTLEEPPPHVVFILATTDPQKLPATVLSRCQKFEFKRISAEGIGKRLKKIVMDSGVTLDDEAAKLIASLSDGALRDAISILDQCLSTGENPITCESVYKMVGMVSGDYMAELIESVIQGDIRRVLEHVEKIVMSGKDMAQFVSDLVYCYRNLLICKTVNNPEDLIQAPAADIERMKALALQLDEDDVIFSIKELSSMESALKWATHPRVLLEVSLIKLCSRRYGSGTDDILERLSALEKRLEAMGDPPPENRNFKEPQRQNAEVKGDSGDGQRDTESPPAETKDISREMGMERLECWNEVLEELKKKRKMTLYSNLYGTTAVMVNPRTVGIIFPPGGNGIKKQIVLERQNRETLASLVSQKLGTSVVIKPLDEGKPAQDNGTGDDPLIERVRELGKEFNIPVDILEE